jgi:DNA-binding NtrC family response regulator
MKDYDFDLLLLDLRMPGMSGFDVLKTLTLKHSNLPIIITTADDSTDSIIECMKNGAFDYLVKPVNRVRTLTSVKNALEWRSNKKEIELLSKSFTDVNLENPEAFKSYITSSQRIKSIFGYLERVAKTSQPILIVGETGVGKEIIANSIHLASNRKGKFVSVNIAGISDQLFSDTLFGHVKGAFTGADKKRDGFVEQAGDGTLHLDEIGDLPHGSQIKLLRLLQEGEYYPEGSDEKKNTTTRFVMTTNRNLEELVDEGTFREDLFYRLQTHHVEIPPLRENTEDISLLFEYFIQQAAKEMNFDTVSYSEEVVNVLKSYKFKGNVREFKGIVFDILIRNNSDVISLDLVKAIINSKRNKKNKFDRDELEHFTDPKAFIHKIPELPSPEQMTEILIREAWQRSGYNQSQVASLLGMSRVAIIKRLKKYNIIK